MAKKVKFSTRSPFAMDSLKFLQMIVDAHLASNKTRIEETKELRKKADNDFSAGYWDGRVDGLFHEKVALEFIQGHLKKEAEKSA